MNNVFSNGTYLPKEKYDLKVIFIFSCFFFECLKGNIFSLSLLNCCLGE
jgi:hypothetical protein